MTGVIVTDWPRATLSEVDELAEFGVATIHEAQGRTGYLGPTIRPVHLGARLAGTAVTVMTAPSDNLMIHAAIEQCRPGDVLIVTTSEPSSDGAVGELIGMALRYRGVRGLVTSGGVRDVAQLHEMGFSVFSAAISAQGTVKETAGSVNIAITIGGISIAPGDVVVGDDDGVVVVPRENLARTRKAAAARLAKETETRAAIQRGELGLDRYGLRATLRRLGVEYVKHGITRD